MSNTTVPSILFPVYRPFIGEQEKKYVNDCLDSSWISSKGEYIQRFEEEFAKYIDAPYAASVCNGTVALHLAILALGIQPGDEIIVPTLTYVASANAIVHAGCKPIFVDSLHSSWQMDPKDIEAKITKHTKAIMAVHLYGQPCDMDALLKICKKYDLLLIEDCAEGFGSFFEGTHVGLFGDIATFSFFGNKTITTGEGGMVVTKNAKVHEAAYTLKTQGMSKQKHYWHDCIAYNYRMTNICAAIGLAQIEKADAIIEKKRQIAKWYRDSLGGLPLKTHEEIGNVKNSYWMCSILLEDANVRADLRNYLLERGIETRPFFFPIHQMPMYDKKEIFPVAESLSSRGINVPSYPALTQENVEEISNTIRSFFR